MVGDSRLVDRGFMQYLMFEDNLGQIKLYLVTPI